MRRFLLLTHRTRSASTDRALGIVLAFNAGALNAGGFMVLRLYTSHMTGFTSQLADGLVLGDPDLLSVAGGALCAFVAGAAACAMLVSWARRHRLRCRYALPLALEALLLFAFGTVGTVGGVSAPRIVTLLAFIMGLQNAVGSKTSRGSQRTTHMTGNLTDVGIEAGKLAFLLLVRNGAADRAAFDPARLRNVVGLVAAFVVGGLMGAWGFRAWSFLCALPLAGLVLVLSLPPVWRDARRFGTARARGAGRCPGA